MLLWRIDPLLSDNSVNSSRCYVKPATYKHATREQRGFCNPFLSNGSVNTPLHRQNYCWKMCFLFGPCRVFIKKKIGTAISVEDWHFGWDLEGRLRIDGATMSWQLTRILHGSLWQEDLREGSWRISTVRNRLQGTAGKDIGWKRLSRCCGYLWNVEISYSAVIAWGSKWWV
jgi:hypothetical protein